jgi:hypothetical protein
MSAPKTITIDNIEYIRKTDAVTTGEKSTNGLVYVIVRTYSAGGHAGYLKEHKDKQVTLVDSRRLFYWSGAASLSQLALEGVSKPKECKFAMVLPTLILTEAIEIIPCSKAAQACIEGLLVWKA